MNRTFLIIILVIQAILFLVHFALYETFSFFFLTGNPSGQLYAAIIFFILSISFVPAQLLSGTRHDAIVRAFYKIAAVWLGSLYFWIAASVLLWLSYDVSSMGSDAPVLEPYAALIVAAALLGAVWAFANAMTVRTTKVSVKIKDLPPAWKGRKAVFASDLHIGHVRGAWHAASVVAEINHAKPDIVFIGGDLFDGVNDDYKKAIAPLKDIKAPLGTYFIFGNHEEFSKTSGYRDAILWAGMNILKDEKAEIEGMQIIGVDYHTSHKPETFAATLKKLVDTEKPSIVLKHEPNNLDVAEKAGASLMISGHTHKAQMWPFSYIARKVYKGYDYGLKPHGKLQQLTSSGAGTWGPPYRVGSRTEIVAIEFK